MRSTVRGKQRRETTPLLFSEQSVTASDGEPIAAAAARSKHNSGLLRLFGRQQQPHEARQTSRRHHHFDVRELTVKSSQSSQQQDSQYSQHEEEEIHRKQRSVSAPAQRQARREKTPHHQLLRLPENSRDSQKKERPFPVSIRRLRSNPAAQDPPAKFTKSRTHPPKLPTIASESYESPESNNKRSTTSPHKQKTPQSQRMMESTVLSSTHDETEVTYSESSDHSTEVPPTPQPTNTSPQPKRAPTTTSTKKTIPMSKTKALLSRPFGRQHLPPSIGRKWVVEVSSAEWDADEQQWKYRLLVQRRQPIQVDDDNDDQQPQSFTAAFTWRSLADFMWLEEALNQEFQGGLVLPVLSIALGRPPDTMEGPVEADKLRIWFSDCLNGIRGQGEMIIRQDVDLIQSEAMEAFLYRKDGPLAVIDSRKQPKDNKCDDNSFLTNLISKSLVPLELCAGSPPMDTARSATETSGPLHRKLPMDILTCSSRALGTAPSLDVQDSFAETASLSTNSPRSAKGIAIHSDLLEAEKELMLNYRKTALNAMEKLQILKTEEEKIGVAWKRFAISLSNLFAYEKDVEMAKLGDMRIKREHMPYRKVSKSAVDDCLRIIARQKVDRSVPALIALNDMLVAYVADMSMVEPAVSAYSEAILQMAFLDDDGGTQDLPKSEGSWEDRFKALASMSMDEVKHQAMKSLNGDAFRSMRAEKEALAQRRAHQMRLSANEQLLQDTLSAMCRATPVRVARMAWRYWNTEASQCALLNSAAASMLANVNVASKDSVSKMIKRHMSEEKEDDVIELDLVQRMVNIGNIKKFSATDTASIDEDTNVEVDTDDQGEERDKGLRRDKALQIARQCIGRWNSKLAVAIMEAVDVDDPNVLMEETTRDLRLVRKYAVGLRENLNRCIEAVQMLRATIKKNYNEDDAIQSKKGKAANHIRENRQVFLLELAKLFSGKFIDEQSKNGKSKGSKPSMSVLAKGGVDTGDPMGWSSVFKPDKRTTRAAFTQGRVGDLGVAYVNAKDSQTEWLLKSMSDLLNEYFERVEVVEGFVYMECVGIQLEKHFNRKRTSALSAFEKKTDLTAAINVARRKRLPKLVRELQVKLDAIGPTVSHTYVKETKEAHLESKSLKSELHGLAMRRLQRARETSTERVVNLLTLWAKEEESAAASELKALGEAMTALERAVSRDDIDGRIDNIASF